MKIEIGKEYKIKKGCEEKCSFYKPGTDRIKITNITLGELYYNFLDKNGGVLGGCAWCYKPEDLEPFTKTLYNLEIGDEVVDKGGDKKTILSILLSSPNNPIYILSYPYKQKDSNKKITYFFRTAFELEMDGYVVFTEQSEQPEEIQEMTVEEIEKIIGYRIKIVK